MPLNFLFMTQTCMVLPGLLAALLVALLSLHCKPVSGTLLAGASAVAVNPPPGAFIAGDKQNRRFQNLSDSLFAKAVVVYDGKTALAILTVDCIGLLYPDIDRIRRRATEQVKNIPLPATHIVVSSTHTHSGPDVVGIWGADYQHSGVDSAYMEFLIQTAAMQVVRAAAGLEAVTLRSAETSFGEPWVQNICQEEIDRAATTLQFVNRIGNPVATLTNFACHPTFLDARFSTVSADYVAGYYRAMDKNGGVNLFLQGAIGGWVQPEDGEATYEKTLRRGEELAQTVQTALQTPKTWTNTALRIQSLPLKFRLDNDAWKQLGAGGIINRLLTDSVETEVAWFAIGDAQFATHPGETAPYYGLETKKMMNTAGPKFVLGLSLDALGYILKPVYFDDPALLHAGYLTSMSVGRQTAPDLMEALRKVIPR